MVKKSNRKGRGGLRDYHRSPEFRAIANAALARFNARRAYLPKCGATRKSDGGSCQNLPLGNGRCRLHGGKTPSGKEWHRPQWPNGKRPDAAVKLQAKIQKLEREARKRAARLATMTDEERDRYERWHKDRPLGSPESRKAARAERERATEAAALFAAAPSDAAPDDPEYRALTEEIAALKAQLARLDEQAAQPAGKIDPDPEVFG